MARSLVVFAEEAGAGKTAIAGGLAQRLHNAGREPLLIRIGEASDEAAAADARLFGRLPFGVGETPLGLTQAASMLGDLDDAVLVAELGASADPVAAAEKLDASVVSAGPISPELREKLGSRYRGWVALGAAGDGDAPLARLSADRVLQAPTVSDVLQSLPVTATVRFLDGNEGDLCETLLIAPISHDTGRIYFAGPHRAAVVCRDDKPELALSALSGSTALLIITGGDEPLGYVTERAAGARIPMVITPEGTVETVQRIETTFKPRKLSHERQLLRSAELLEAVELDALLS
ncbi:MAG: DRTGG domain-containing protein [Dehalococcoidia bacterium]